MLIQWFTQARQRFEAPITDKEEAIEYCTKQLKGELECEDRAQTLYSLKILKAKLPADFLINIMNNDSDIDVRDSAIENALYLTDEDDKSKVGKALYNIVKLNFEKKNFINKKHFSKQLKNGCYPYCESTIQCSALKVLARTDRSEYEDLIFDWFVNEKVYLISYLGKKIREGLIPKIEKQLLVIKDGNEKNRYLETLILLLGNDPEKYVGVLKEQLTSKDKETVERTAKLLILIKNDPYMKEHYKFENLKKSIEPELLRIKNKNIIKEIERSENKGISPCL